MNQANDAPTSPYPPGETMIISFSANQTRPRDAANVINRGVIERDALTGLIGRNMKLIPLLSG